MNETLKRGISGAIYIALLLSSILFSTESFIILFGIFLIIATYEFCNLIQLNKVFPLFFGALFYSSISLISFYKKANWQLFDGEFLVNHENIEAKLMYLLPISEKLISINKKF